MKIKIFTVMFFAIALLSCTKENLSPIDRSIYIGEWKHSGNYVFNDPIMSKFTSQGGYFLVKDSTNEKQLKDVNCPEVRIFTLIDSKSFTQSELSFIGRTEKLEKINIKVTNIIGTLNDSTFISLKGDVIADGLIDGVPTTIKGVYYGTLRK